MANARASLKGMEKSQLPASTTCVLLLTGIHAVTPCTTASTKAWRKSTGMKTVRAALNKNNAGVRGLDMARIAFFDLEPWEEAYFSKRLKRHTLSFFPTKIHDSRLGKAAKADAIAAFIFSPVNGPTIKRFPNLKLVTTMSTGFDHIDLVECRKRGITACNVPAYGDNTVAEHAFALLLAIARKLPESVDRTRRGNFSREGLRGFDLKGKTIGIVGTGKIGKHAARIAHGFQMAVLAYDPFPDHALEAELGMQYVTLEKLLAESDIVTLHAPLTAKTKHIISAKALCRTKHGIASI